MPLKNKKQVISWCLFDFANSSYSAVISAVIFPVYFANYIVGNESGLGDLWWGRAVSLSMAFIVLTSPFLGGIADFGGIRKRLLFLYTMLCISAVASFSLIQKGMAVEGFILVIIANIGMEGGFAFYNSFLPEITEKEYHGRVSAWGYAVGYAGSILSLVLALTLINRGYFDLTWLMISAFFGIFSLPAFLFLPADRKKESGLMHAASKGMRDTWMTFKKIWTNKETRKFLISYFIFEDGVNTVIVFSSIFAATTLGFNTQELIMLYIIVQISALAGAFLMARPIDTWGPKKVISLSLLMWSSVSILAYFAETKPHFWVIACIAGFGLGTVQAAARAFFTQFVPLEHESEYFGVYSMVGKSSAIFGPLLFGYISSSFGSQRPAILSVAVFFIVGLISLQFVKGGGPNVKDT
ncbi:MAG: MFS transporter [Thermodesulfovibrionales bacterium]|nr:MFS transporter [Thermodesulfovibrionales bacterium]